MLRGAEHRKPMPTAKSITGMRRRRTSFRVTRGGRQRAEGSAAAVVSSKISRRDVFGIAPMCEELRIGARPEVWAIWVQPPPLAFDDHPGFVAVVNKFFRGSFLGDSSDRVRAFGQLRRKRFQAGRHLF